MSTVRKISLPNWQFKEASESAWKSATVPGCVHTDLLAHNEIPDPFVGKNELDIQWVDKKDWEYVSYFTLTELDMAEERLELIFEGLDTYADIYVNSKQVLLTDNMFRMWKVDIKSYVQEGENSLHVYFHSPIAHDLNKPNELGYNLPADNDHSKDGGVGEKKLSVFARKAPYHYGWDWGPRFVTSGIWRNVYIEAWSHVCMQDVFIEQSHVTKEIAKLKANVELEASFPQVVTISITDNNGFIHEERVQVKKGKQTIAIPFSIINPQLWWSNGLGEPYLYHFSIDLFHNETLKSSRKIKTGLRSIRFVRDHDQDGQSFHFELNGVPVFMKGANHIPNDSFLTRVEKEDYEHEIASAKTSHMNMLRVWGGGIYEPNVFYELCDEYGILVWQDFMFACSMYPGDKAFLDNVEQEAIDNVKRLRNYACIALWCGNNEMDSAWAEYVEDAGWGWKQRYNLAQRKSIWQAYDQLFHQLLPEVIRKYDTNTAYWPSSPLQDLTFDQGQHATFASLKKGDIHYWDVWHGQKPLKAYKENVGRFMSEYGFQSFPEESTVRKYAEEKDFTLESGVMLHHQKNGSGNRLIKTYMDMYYKEPKDFASFLHLSQILQANAIRSAVEAHRMEMPYCMGTLYWQMNDCWPVASWSSMDYYGRWKALQYEMKDRFKPTILIVDQQAEQVMCTVVSDLQQDQLANLTLQIVSCEGQNVLEEKVNIEIPKNASTKIHLLDLEDKKDRINNSVLVAKLEIDELIVDEVTHLFVEPKQMQLQDPNIHVEMIEDGIELSCDHFAMNVWMETEEEGYFSANNFHLVPGERKQIYFTDSHIQNQYFENKHIPRDIYVQSMYNFITF
ncbi:beta-mannosidase [Gracilibacillus saliphilus]|uniref:beta-mannosidase n=1 Tax=Gracilibacillus saliphilus TaxID=543890 RepID=UPI0013D56975|nr:glycoside hydrolase family 2 protein [Gracilibacillus saliphilus]